MDKEIKDLALLNGHTVITTETLQEKPKNAKFYDKPSFVMVGSGKHNRQGKSMDTLNEMCEMSKPEQWLMKNLMVRLSIENKTIFISGGLNESDKNKLKHGYKALHNKDIVKRISPQHYMINPNFIVPKKNYKKLDAEFKEIGNE